MRNPVKAITTAASVLALAFGANAALATEATQASAGKLSNGSEVTAVTLTAGNGVSATILTFGATLWKLNAPDRDGKTADVLVAYDKLSDFETRPNFWGATIGRYGNRIADGKFTLDGKTYQLPGNDHGQSLHGGGKGFDVQNWKLESVKSGKVATAVFSLVSPDGDSGYPGTVKAKVTYSLDESGNLQIVFDATTDKPTVLNMTNHAIFNMAGEGSERDAMTNVLTLPASKYTPVNEKLIPTGELRAVEGTPFDFRNGKPVAVGLRDGNDQQIVYGRGFDHNFALDKGQTKTPELAARLEDPVSGRVLELLTTEPGVQFYSGNFLDGTFIGKQGHLYRMGDGIALEPQKFPDSPNHANFPSTRVDPGKPYRHVMIYRVTTSPR
ncbi:aldose epimerase family protein [Novosphingobium resinovorum]|uniref:Aldose 1-epimerase n=1 Tax=Novosphingobium resinovorum TaxID=158500 RepID=A0A031JZF9_9SPHN|nr:MULTISPECIES: aldose epimerase family protein [Sphingomonadaceae]AOR76498.1 galactose mutarotase [Novosphingobium resinovorum]EJU13093.1 aldose 1-epimerase [Sphingomonas sp. LH128]EZP83136.1 Aldose 1-epimerase [Novosphingobium resinovorum]MBF7011768.1 galactose mutarotase [Novosphingobium sp. HR1a]WJM26521.1 aldose epimerase family protein [Novosphingobium resinovorum]